MYMPYVYKNFRLISAGMPIMLNISVCVNRHFCCNVIWCYIKDLGPWYTTFLPRCTVSTLRMCKTFAYSMQFAWTYKNETEGTGNSRKRMGIHNDIWSVIFCLLFWYTQKALSPRPLQYRPGDYRRYRYRLKWNHSWKILLWNWHRKPRL